MTDLKAARGLENTVVKMKCVSTTHMLAEILAKDMSADEIFSRLIEAGMYMLIWTHQESAVEEHRRWFRQRQQQRRKSICAETNSLLENSPVVLVQVVFVFIMTTANMAVCEE